MRPTVFRTVVARDNNVIRVDFRREPDPPAPRFPGAGAMRLPDRRDDADLTVQPCEMNLVTR